MEKPETDYMCEDIESLRAKGRSNSTPPCNKPGCGCKIPIIGMTVAVCVSWIFNHSVLWAIVHGLLNWFYVAYKTIWYVTKYY